MTVGAELAASVNGGGDAKENRIAVVKAAEAVVVAKGSEHALTCEREVTGTFGVAEKDQDWAAEHVEELEGLFEEAGVWEAPGWAV